MGTFTYIFAAYTVIWLIALIYSYSIGARQKSLEREIEMLKSVVEEKEAGAQAEDGGVGARESGETWSAAR